MKCMLYRINTVERHLKHSGTKDNITMSNPLGNLDSETLILRHKSHLSEKKLLF